MTKRNKTKGQTMIYKTLYRNLKIEQHELKTEGELEWSGKVNSFCSTIKPYFDLNIAEILFICQSINQINYFLAINIATEHFFHISLQPAALQELAMLTNTGAPEFTPVGFVLLKLQFYVNVLQIVVCPFILFLLAIVLSVLLRYTDSLWYLQILLVLRSSSRFCCIINVSLSLCKQLIYNGNYIKRTILFSIRLLGVSNLLQKSCSILSSEIEHNKQFCIVYCCKIMGYYEKQAL